MLIYVFIEHFSENTGLKFQIKSLKSWYMFTV